MAEQVTDGLDRRAPTKKVNCERMTQAMRPLVWDWEAASARPRLERLRDRRRLEYSGRRPDAQEYLAIRKRGAIASKVVCDGRADLLRQWHDDRRQIGSASR